MGNTVTPQKISFLLNAFPKLSETFILNEIWELKNKGSDIFLVAMGSTQEKVAHAKAQAIAPEVMFLNKVGRRRKLENALIAGIHHPLRLLQTVVFIWKKYQKKRIWNLKQALYLGGELIRRGIRHVHAHFAMDAAEKAMLTGLLTGIPYSMHPHALDIYVRPSLLREKMKFAKFVSTECEFNRRYLLENYNGYPEQNISVIRLGIDLKMFAPNTLEAPQVLKKNGLVISSVARLVEKKGLINLLKAFKRVVGEGIKAKVVIVGEGPEYVRLEKFIAENGLGELVELKGSRPSEYVRDLFRITDLFVLPCIVAKNGDQDATPTAILEAMAMKIPVISTCVAGIPEVIPSEAGIVVQPNDVDALADAIKKIDGMEPAERNTMGEAGRRYVGENCNIERETEKLMALFDM